MRRKSYGIVSSGDGTFLFAGCEKTALGWRLTHIRRWSADSRLNNALLLHRGVVAATPCRWKRSGDGTGALSDPLVGALSEGAFIPLASGMAVSAYSDRLTGNLLAVVGDDAFLCTIPLALYNGEAQSFVSVYPAGQFYKIGIITDRTLSAVFTMAPATPQALESHLGRIKRYWHLRTGGGGAQFPDRLYVFGDGDLGTAGWAPAAMRPECGTMGIDIADTGVLAAAGAALAADGGDCGTVPRFPVPSATAERAAFRGARTAVYAASAALVLCSLLLTAVVSVSLFFTHKSLARYTQEYRQVLPDIALLTAQNDSLARAVLSTVSAGSRQTRWAQFLQFLGADKPEGLFFDMLASDAPAPASASGAAGVVRIALSGWAYNESLVTGFISSLQKNNACSSVSLSSLDKNDARNVFSFRILCSMQLFAGSPEK